MSISRTMQQTMRARRQVHALTDGRCFYCGIHVECAGEPLPRDWLPIRGDLKIVIEHAVPLARGGTDELDNRLPSCWACNAAKGRLTVKEFRLLRGLRAGIPNKAFAGERRSVERHWLCCHSPEFERTLFFANMPYAVDAYARARSLRKHQKTLTRSLPR